MSDTAAIILGVSIISCPLLLEIGYAIYEWRYRRWLRDEARRSWARLDYERELAAKFDAVLNSTARADANTTNK